MKPENEATKDTGEKVTLAYWYLTVLSDFSEKERLLVTNLAKRSHNATQVSFTSYQGFISVSDCSTK